MHPTTLRTPLRGLALLGLIVTSPVLAQSAPNAANAPLVTPFSAARPGATPPAGWQPVKINDQKKPTAYQLVDDGGTVVLHASADDAASLMGFRPTFDLRSAPVVEWRWKVKNLIPSADNTVAGKEDSPVRLVLEFEGDKSKLSLGDRATLATSKALSGRELPHSTLMYIWSNKEPVGKVVRNPHTQRVQMVVASSGPAGVGAWQTLSRNAVEDFRRAFNEEPGKLVGVAVLTDTDNTGEKVEAWYGDIRFESSAR